MGELSNTPQSKLRTPPLLPMDLILEPKDWFKIGSPLRYFVLRPKVVFYVLGLVPNDSPRIPSAGICDWGACWRGGTPEATPSQRRRRGVMHPAKNGE
jgi:hypothetical protein